MTMTDNHTETARQIQLVLTEIGDMLIEKNRRYGDSALSPVRVFSTASTIEQINVRLDDKLSRIMAARDNLDIEDAELDLLGYLVLRRIAKLRAQTA